jgi:uncharacterized protein YdhG (YjbR/CyaY superfamily)
MSDPGPIDAYLANRPADQQLALGQLRATLRSLLPDAIEVISYAMPGFRLPGAKGKVVAGFAGFARNCGYYPHAGNIIPAFATELDALGFKHTDGAIQFTPAQPLPDDLVARLVAARLKDISA